MSELLPSSLGNPDAKEEIDVRANVKSRQMHRKIGCFAAIFCVTALGVSLGYREITSPDVGFHLNSGRWIAEHHQVPRIETFVEPVAGRAYTDMQWLYQWVLWHIFQAGGTFGIIVGNIAATILACALAGWRIYRSQRRITAGFALLLFVFFLGNEWELRPHVCSWVLLNLVLLSLEEFDRGNQRAIWALPPIMFLWANCHSLYIIGIVVLGCYFAVWTWEAGRRNQWTALRLPAGIAVAAVAACCVTPFGFDGLAFPFEQFRMISVGNIFNDPKGGITEFFSPLRLDRFWVGDHARFLSPNLFWLVTIILVLWGYVAYFRRVLLVEWLLLVAFGYLLVTANKNYGYFVMAVLPVASTGIGGRPNLAAAGVGSWPGWGYGLAILSLSCFPAVISGALYAAACAPYVLGNGFSRQHLPVEAGQLLSGLKDSGRGFNVLGHGGYLGFITRRPMFVDGRLEVIKADHYGRYRATMDAETFARELTSYHADWVVVPFNDFPSWQEGLARRPEWRLVQLTEFNALYFRRGFASEIPALPKPVRGRDYPDVPQETIHGILAGAEARSTRTGLGLLNGRIGRPIKASQLSVFYLRTPYVDAALAWALESLKESTYFAPDIWISATCAFEWSGDTANADRCLSVLRVKVPSRRTEMFVQTIVGNRNTRRR